MPTPARSAQADTRNPLLALPAMAQLQALPAEQRAALAGLLRELGADAHARAERAWRQRKGPMAAYWRAVGVYAGHTARALRSAPEAPHEVACGECAEFHLSNDPRCPIVQGLVQ